MTMLEYFDEGSSWFHAFYLVTLGNVFGCTCDLR
jgi:hypothetical protein